MLYNALAWKNIKTHTKNKKFKITTPMWNDKNLDYLMDQILYQIFKVIVSVSSKNLKQ